MTTIDQTLTTTPAGLAPEVLAIAAVDLYRDIHKGIRAELFALVHEAASADPAATLERVALADHVASVQRLLETHAEHEDEHCQPSVEALLPAIAERVLGEHHALELRIQELVDRARELATATGGDLRSALHWLQLDLASFTSSYLAHQDLEERVIMPELDRVLGPERCLEIHTAIVSSIPPDEMAQSLALMLPAMNVDDRTELLGGIRVGAPPEVFAGVVDLARSVLRPEEADALAGRLGI